MQAIDLIQSINKLKATADSLSDSPLREGYLMGLRHAIELAEVLQFRAELAEARRQQEGK